MPIGDELEQAIDVYAETGYWGDDEPPTIEGRYDPDLVESLYDDNGTRYLARLTSPRDSLRTRATVSRVRRRA